MLKFNNLRNKLFCIYYTVLVYIFSAWCTVLQLILPHHKPKIVPQDGKVALITGGIRGIGYETSVQLLAAGMIVVVAGKKTASFPEKILALQKKYEDRYFILECDLSSLNSVRKFVKNFNAMNLPLHLLINNAGVMFVNRCEKNGLESHWVINYLSHFLLTHLLLDKLIASASQYQPARIVNLSSCLHYLGSINFDDLQGRSCYSAEAAYSQSKLAMVMFTENLARRLQKNKILVLVNSVHPAIAFSNLMEHVWWFDNVLLSKVAKYILTTPAMGSDTVVYAATSPNIKDGGKYYENCQPKTPSREARSIDFQDKLWKISCSQALIKSCI